MRVPLVVSAAIGAVMVVALAITLFIGLSVAAPIFEAVDVTAPGGAGKGDVNFDLGILLFGTAGILSIPLSIALAAFFGGDIPER